MSRIENSTQLAVTALTADEVKVLRGETGAVSLIVGPLHILAGYESATAQEMAEASSALRVLSSKAREVADDLTLRIVARSPYVPFNAEDNAFARRAAAVTE